MRTESLEFFKKLIETPSPSGFELEGQKVWIDYVSKFADKTYLTVNTAAIGIVNPDAKVRVMLAGHGDELGLMISYINDGGYIYFKQLGGYDPTILCGQRVIIHSSVGESICGVIGKKSIHMTKRDAVGKAMKISDLWIDIGAKDKEDAEKLIAIADPITLDIGWMDLQNNLAVARAFDDRAGSFIVAEVLRLVAEAKPKVGVYAVSTSQEETTGVGAKTATYEINPDIAIVVDVTNTTDYPGTDKIKYGDNKIGEGPVISRGSMLNKGVALRLIKIAKEKEIPYQIEAVAGWTGTDASSIVPIRSGVATGEIGIPNRYMHTPVELISLDDVDNIIKLIVEFVLSLEADVSFIPK